MNEVPLYYQPGRHDSEDSWFRGWMVEGAGFRVQVAVGGEFMWSRV